MEWWNMANDLTQVKKDIMKGIHECNIRGLIHAGKRKTKLYFIDSVVTRIVYFRKVAGRIESWIKN